MHESFKALVIPNTSIENNIKIIFEIDKHF